MMIGAFACSQSLIGAYSGTKKVVRRGPKVPFFEQIRTNKVEKKVDLPETSPG
jgi:hypothetical protein